jgi:hypothetical protein
MYGIPQLLISKETLIKKDLNNGEPNHKIIIKILRSHVFKILTRKLFLARMYILKLNNKKKIMIAQEIMVEEIMIDLG